MDPRRLRASLEDGSSVRAVLPVHTFGGMADMRALCAIAEEYSVPVVEDAACALGASLDGRAAGAWGSLGCFSFHPRKAVTTGEGGAVVGRDENLLKAIRRLRNHGQDVSSSPVDFVEPGFNLRLTEFQAALGVAQLHKFDRIIAARRERASRYDALLADTSLVRQMSLAEGAHVYQAYVVLVPKEGAARRDAVIAQMRTEGVEVTIGTHHIPTLSYYRQRYGFTAAQHLVSADVAARAIALPLHSHLTSDEQSRVVEVLLNAL
jgi:dTDP-4-amino-4,6-dideoxygalactose transaminase